MACIWDTDTIRDEVQNKASLYDLIIGQSPHHSDAYYRKRLSDKEAILKKYDKRSTGVNTIAAAHIRLKEFEKAEQLLMAQVKVTPKDYYTNSNLGVMYKKLGNFQKAVYYMEKALEIRPQGHMGLGDWYLRMLMYKSEEIDLEKNFLGEEYVKYYGRDTKTTREEVLKRSKFEKLIRNDQSFADGFLSLADFLASKGDLNLAIRAYLRAEKLGHPKKEFITRKINMLVTHFYKLGGREPKGLADKVAIERKKIEAEFTKAALWVEEFKKVETELLQKKSKVEYKEVYAALKKKGIKSYYPSK